MTNFHLSDSSFLIFVCLIVLERTKRSIFVRWVRHVGPLSRRSDMRVEREGVHVFVELQED